LIEMLIVVPRLSGVGRRANEGARKGDLHQRRNAIQQFEADCGDYPAALDGANCADWWA